MKSVNKSILALAIPSIIANITTPLLGLVDMAIVGHMGSAVYVAAIALGGTIFSMVYWVFAFLRMGTSGLTAQAYGAGDRATRDDTLWRGLIVSALFGVALMAAQTPLIGAMLRFMGSDEATNALTRQYFSILIYGSPATLGLYAVNGWLIGMQNSRATMWLSLTINVVNIAASLTLVYALGLGIKGVASGTLAAQWIGFLVGLALCLRYKPRWRSLRQALDRRHLKRFLSVNADIFLRTLCLVAVTVWFTRAGAMQSDIILSVNALIMQLFMLFSYMMDGYAFAGEALVGKLTGSGDNKKRRSVVRALFIHGTVVALSFTIVYMLFGDAILGVLSDNADILRASADYRWWAVTIPFAGMGAFIWDGIFIGATKTRGMLASMAAAMGVFFAVYFGLFPAMGNHAVWLAFILYLLVRGLMQSVLWLRYSSRGL